MARILVTGSAGLIGSQACDFLHEKGFLIIGIDNDMRSYFFGKEASTVTDADQCTIVRGSTLKVESNRGYNIKNVE